MIPDPLHPAIVHFPVVLAVALPLVVLYVLVRHRTTPPTRSTWAGVVLLSLALAGSSWLALETGEAQEETVEDVVPRTALHAHEEAAEALLGVTVITVLVALTGLAGGRAGSAARIATGVAALAVVVAGYRVGHSGGELVYRHGAAQAYVQGASSQARIDLTGRADRDDDDDERHR
ncbi:MAG: DUF2231 domain-containing protein [Gemmatimonadota bacterium]